MATDDERLGRQAQRTEQLLLAVREALQRRQAALVARTDGGSPIAALPEAGESTSEVAVALGGAAGAASTDAARYDGPESEAAPVTQAVRWRVDPPAPTISTFLHLWIWVWAAVRFFAGNLFDRATFRAHVKRRAVRLRLTLQNLGPTFIKVGQQLAVRTDVLREEYCRELEKLLDKLPPMPWEAARSSLEELTGRPLAETFSEFSETPIGSASLACVYRAQLVTGERVVVKIMRPKVARRMATELRALGWIARAFEALGIIAEEMAVSIFEELDVMLKEELDFRREARNAELFRRGAKHDGQVGFSAPRIHWKLLGERVLTMEWVEGPSVQELIEAVEKNNQVRLAEFAGQGIEPKRVSSRLAQALHWELNEGLLFHGDPHPANILVRPGGELVFIDFGSCGKVNGKFRRTWREFYLAYARNDVHAMVEGVMQLLEPLPAIDVTRFSKELEVVLWDFVHAARSPHSYWFERASGAVWMRFASIARKYNVPMSVETVRLFRATFLYDTVMFRLWGGDRMPDPKGKYRKYLRDAGRRARDRVVDAVRLRLEHGLQPEDYLEIEGAWRFGQQAATTLQHLMDLPQAIYRNVISKISYAIQLVVRAAISVAGAGVIILIVELAAHLKYTVRNDQVPDLQTAWETAWVDTIHGYPLGVVALVVAVATGVRMMRRVVQFDV